MSPWSLSLSQSHSVRKEQQDLDFDSEIRRLDHFFSYIRHTFFLLAKQAQSKWLPILG